MGLWEDLVQLEKFMSRGQKWRRPEPIENELLVLCCNINERQPASLISEYIFTRFGVLVRVAPSNTFILQCLRFWRPRCSKGNAAIISRMLKSLIWHFTTTNLWAASLCTLSPDRTGSSSESMPARCGGTKQPPFGRFDLFSHVLVWGFQLAGLVF